MKTWFRKIVLLGVLLAGTGNTPAEITFVFRYEQTDWSAESKAALEGAAKVVGRWFSNSNTVTITVSKDPACDGSLGGAGSSLLSGVGFQYTLAQRQAIFGDQPPPHGIFDANFCPKHDWDFSERITGRGADFRSMVMHELLHCLGWIGDLPSTAADTGHWGYWDQFVSDAAGNRLIDSSTFKAIPSLRPVVTNTASGMCFSGPNVMVAFTNQPQKLETLDPWSNGSSCYHSAHPEHLMYMSGGAGGPEARSLSAFEAAVMKDLGYTLNAVVEFSTPTVTVNKPPSNTGKTDEASVGKSGLLQPETGSQTTNWLTLTLVRRGDTSTAGSVDYQTIPHTGKGWAIEGQKFLAAGGRLDFPAGVVTNSVQIAVLSDTNRSSTISKVELVLSNPQGGVILDGMTNLILKIKDEETGLRQTALHESFNAAALPPGWTLRANGDASAVWCFDNPAARANNSGGKGNFAIADSRHAGAVDMDTELLAPPLNLSHFDYVELEFNYDFPYDSTGAEQLEVSYSTNGTAGPWTLLWDAPEIRTSRRLGFPSTLWRSGNFSGPQSDVVEVPEDVGDSTNVVFRFHFFGATNSTWFALDEVRVFGYIDYEDRTDEAAGQLPAWWQEMFFADDQEHSPEGDDDGDGYSNYEEYIAGTDPADPQDQPMVDDVETGENGQITSFFAQPGREYTLSYSNLISGGWVTVRSNLMAEAEDLQVTNNLTASARYRLEVTHPGYPDRVYAYYSFTNRLGALPANVAVSAGAYVDRVRLNWTPDPRAWKYQVWRNTSNNLATAQMVGQPARPPFDDTSVSLGTQYYYWLQTLDALGTGLGLQATGPGFASDLHLNVITAGAAAFELSWPSRTGISYTLLYTTNLNAAVNWSVVTNATGDGATLKVLCPIQSNINQFYRLRTP